MGCSWQTKLLTRSNALTHQPSKHRRRQSNDGAHDSRAGIGFGGGVTDTVWFTVRIDTGLRAVTVTFTSPVALNVYVRLLPIPDSCTTAPVSYSPPHIHAHTQQGKPSRVHSHVREPPHERIHLTAPSQHAFSHQHDTRDRHFAHDRLACDVPVQ